MFRYSRYIISNLAGATLFIASGLTCVIWLTQSLRFVDLIVNRGLDILAFLYLTTMLLPSLLGFLLPIALAISTLYSYNKLVADSELVVMKCAGLSRWQLAKPALLFAAAMVILGYLISLYLLPLTYRQYKDMQAFARDNYASLLLQEGVFNTPVEGLTVFIRERQSDGILRGILVHDNRNPDAPVTMMAEEGKLVKTPQGPRFILQNGNRQEVDHQKEQLSFLGFENYALDISLFAEQKEKRARDAKERYIGELLNPEPGTSAKELAKFRSEAHQRISWPLYNLGLTVFVLAILLASEFSRRGNWKRYTLAMVMTGAILAFGIAINNIAVNYPYLIPFMYICPLATIAGGFYSLLRNPLERPVPKDPPEQVLSAGGAP